MERVEHFEERSPYFDRQVNYTAAAGERNDVTISVDLNDTSYTGTITVTDVRARLKVKGGCKLVDEHTAVCASEREFFGRLNVDLGDRGDSLKLASTVRSGMTSRLLGGAGADTIEGGPLSETIDGGPGNDELDGGGDTDHRISGGGGRDRMNGRGGDFLTDGDDESDPDADVFIGDGTSGIDYSSRRGPVRVDMPAGTAGAPGEGDEIEGILYAHGGAGDDLLIGSDGPSFLNGHGGADSLQGRGGNDILEAGRGADLAYGGSGDDTFRNSEDDFVDTTHCGSGFDRVEGQDARDVLRRNCEEAGWNMSRPTGGGTALFSESITVRPAFGDRTVTFQGSCPSEQCYGVIELRTRHSRKLLGRGRFEIVGEQSGPMRAKVTELGYEYLFERPGRYVRVVVRADSQRACPDCLNLRPATSGFTTIIR